MPIDNNGIIYVEETKEKQPESEKKKVNIKDICLIITTCISVLSVIFMISQNKLQKSEYENHIKELELEELKYENMLAESKIHLRTSYLLCSIDDARTLWSTFDEYDIKIFSNEIAGLFYDKETKDYYQNGDILNLDDELKDEYLSVESEIIFLRIDIVSNRLVNNLTLDCLKVDAESNFNYNLDDFSSFKVENVNEENSEYITIDIGDVFPGEMILVPLAIRYVANYKVSDDRNDYYNYDYITYKTVYIPQSISYNDEFNHQKFSSEIRDMYSGAFMMEYTFFGLG